MIKKIFIFRHGQTDWNRDQRWQGHVDIPLNELGLRQAQGLALVAQGWRLDGVYSSDLVRAQQTGRLVAERSNIPIEFDARLREGAFGDAEGLTKDEILAKYGREFLHRWMTLEERNLDLSFPRGETRRQIRTRLLEALHEILPNSPWSRIGISTHGGILKHLLRIIDQDLKLPTPIPNCSTYELDFEVVSKEFRIIQFHPTEAASLASAGANE